MDSWKNNRTDERQCDDDPQRTFLPPREIVARRAYRLWQSRGCPQGTATVDWLQAEAEMRDAGAFRSGKCENRRHRELFSCDAAIDEASEESFPASDPPASTHCSCT